jgi:S1-C subfamily serine protease
MSKAALYSQSGRTRKAVAPPAPAVAAPAGATAQAPGADGSPPYSRRPPSRLRRFVLRWQRPLLVAAGGIAVLAAVAVHALFTPGARQLTQEDIDAAVLHSLETNRMPSAASKAYEAVRRSVVRVRGTGHEKGKDGKPAEGVGSGVVIVDTGIILTNMHVVAGADRVTVEFEDGMESEATVIGVRPEHDLAVLQAQKLPDDLPAATLRSTADLVPGDEVIAVGFPFAIGPSVSSGVISGLRRDYFSTQGKRLLTNLIQFDAAANPGNSGGPLVTTDGEVVGIVTGILNPTEQRVFIGIGFAVPIENAAAAAGLSPF